MNSYTNNQFNNIEMFFNQGMPIKYINIYYQIQIINKTIKIDLILEMTSTINFQKESNYPQMIKNTLTNSNRFINHSYYYFIRNCSNTSCYSSSINRHLFKLLSITFIFIQSKLRPQYTQSTEVQTKISHFLSHILNSGSLELTETFEDFKVTYLIKLISNILIHALENIGSLPNHQYAFLGQNSDDVLMMIQIYKKNPLSQVISSQEWNQLTSLITQNKIKIFNPYTTTQTTQEMQGYSYQQNIYLDIVFASLDQMLIFQEPFKKFIFDNYHTFSLAPTSGLVPQLSLKKLNDFLLQPQITFVYDLLIQITKAENKRLTQGQFTQSLTQLMGQITVYFKKGNFIQTIIQNFSQNSLESIFQKYLWNMEIFQSLNKNQFIERIKLFYFENPQHRLDQKEFIQKTMTPAKQGSVLKKDLQIMIIIGTLIQLETSLLDQIILISKQYLFFFINNFNSRKTTQLSSKLNDSNYYLKQIEKIKQKCVNNGDEYCDCRKCQSIRKNRDSAKQSQKRKREALEKLGPLQENFEKLEKKVNTLQEQNVLLKGLLADLIQHPAMQEIASEFAKDQCELGDFYLDSSEKGYLTEC